MTSNLRSRRVAVLTALAIAPLLAHCASSSAPDESTILAKYGADAGQGGGSPSSKEGAMSAGASSSSGASQGASNSSLEGGDDSGSPNASEGGSAACAANDKFPQSAFLPLAVSLGPKLVPGQSDPIPGDGGGAPPAGWDFHQGGLCRDGSPAGFYVHYSAASSDKLYIYLDGGGACDSATFCSHTPGNLATTFNGGAASQGQTIGGSLGFGSAPQQPYVATNGYSPGIFDFTNSANPFKDWNAVYVPYCTGDVHFGTVEGVDIPDQGLTAGPKQQHFVGRLNLEKYIGQIVPTFPNLSQVLLTGASAGGFGAGLNYGMVQDTFGTNVPVAVLDDSGPPFSVQYLPACLQKAWRELWGFDKALPSDCAECSNPDGSGLTDVVYYWMRKYKNAKVGLISTMQDEVIRLFFAQGDMTCASNDATLLAFGQIAGYSGMEYTDGLDDLRTTFACTNRLASYFIGGMNPMYMNPTFHQHIFRDEFYQAITNDGSITMAQWASDFVEGKLENVGP